MCNVCGCGSGEVRLEGEALDADHQHVHTHADGTAHTHAHDHHGAHGHGHGHDHHHGHDHDHDHDHVHYGTGPAGAHAPGMSQSRMVQIEQDILGKNNAYARANREWLADHGVFALNFVSSPGSGKTTLLVRTIEALKHEFPVVVIEGDQQTSFDAERIRATGVRAVQINTGKGCHLDAHMVGHAIEQLSVPDDALLLIENVGNLVCPSAFDLGEAHKVVILSVTEGEDKPLKYPDMFRAADLMLLNKVDLLPHLQFNVARASNFARQVHAELPILHTSATTGEGFDAWLDWLREGVRHAREQRVSTVEALRDRVAELERQLAARA